MLVAPNPDTTSAISVEFGKKVFNLNPSVELIPNNMPKSNATN